MKSMKVDYTHYLPQLIDRLKINKLFKVILFGSYAYGQPKENSDIDLLVVLDEERLPNSFDEKMNYKLLVRNSIIDLSQKIPIDLIVHTKPMYDQFIALGSMFSKEILTKGKILYEKSKRINL